MIEPCDENWDNVFSRGFYFYIKYFTNRCKKNIVCYKEDTVYNDMIIRDTILHIYHSMRNIDPPNSV